MRHLSRFATLGLMGLLVCAVLPAQETGVQPISIGDAKVAACVNNLGQNLMRQDGAQVPIRIGLESPSTSASALQPKLIEDPVIAACVDLLAQHILQAGAGPIPFTIKATPSR
ncbi:MAG TPA: hypothetical protein VK686_21220 [Bryobacteraceae bacterium]|jgi:hypothetical protein|nr:hypothetical protein [Bryobacteraceae bacterium]